MRPKERDLHTQLGEALSAFEEAEQFLPGIRNASSRSALLEQILESIRRVKYVKTLLYRDISDRRTNPDDEMFDPLKAAALHARRGSVEEAIWLVFLAVHFGRHRIGGWRYVREVYGRLGGPERWDWQNASSSPRDFIAWLDSNVLVLRRKGAGFSNHRKYQSLDAHSETGTGAAITSYIRWVNPPRTQQQVLDQAIMAVDGDPRKAFDVLFGSLGAVASFGRMARFDFLAMLGKLELAAITPGKAYLDGATGPLTGARMLFGNKDSARRLDEQLIKLDSYLRVGMQVLEDAICNWQKSPTSFKAFRG